MQKTIKNAIKSFLIVSMVSVVSHASFRPVFEITRTALVEQNGARLAKTIQQLLDGDHVTLKNIGAVLKNGQELLAKCMRNGRYRGEVIAMYRRIFEDISFKRKITKPGRSVVQFTEDWVRYNDDALIDNLARNGYGVTFVDFANTVLGGGWDAGGNVQEEQMVQQCPDLALLLSKEVNRDGDHGLYTRRHSGPKPNDEFEAMLALRGPGEDSADPILLTHIRPLQAIRDDYRKNWMRIREEPYVVEEVLTAVPDARPINIIAMSAPEIFYDYRGKVYSKELVYDLFNNAVTAFELVVRFDREASISTHLITGRWGAGAFGHNVNMVIAVQYLAARLARVDQLEFSGVSQQDGQWVIEWVDDLIDHVFDGDVSSTAQDILDAMLKSPKTADWKTKPL